MDVAEQDADASDLGAAAGRDHDAGALAGCDHRTRVGHAAAVAENGIGGNCRLVLPGSDRFTGQNRLVDQQSARADEAQVGRYAVAGFDQHDIAGDDLGNGHTLAVPVAEHAAAWRDHAADGSQRVLCLAFLDEADDGIGDHDGNDHPGVDEMAEKPGCQCAREKEVDQGVVELGEKAQERAARRRRRKLVPAVLAQAFGCFLGRQAR